LNSIVGFSLFPNPTVRISLPGTPTSYSACSQHTLCHIEVHKPVTTSTLGQLFSLPLFTEANFRADRILGVGRVILQGDGRLLHSALARTILPLPNACRRLSVYFWPGLLRLGENNLRCDGVAESIKQILGTTLPRTSPVCPHPWENRTIQPEAINSTSRMTARQLLLHLPIDQKEDDFKGVFTVVSRLVTTTSCLQKSR
jgi:hypothetical protein